MKKTLLLILLNVLLVTYLPQANAKLDPKHYKNWIGPQECAECHEDEAAIWKNAHHFLSFKKMARSKDAKKMAKKMKIKRIKTSPYCADCHYTLMPKGSSKRVRAIAGPSCESCHGPAKNWNDIHDDYGGKHIKAKQESAAHKKLRWKKAEAAGMIRPKRMYKIFHQCYECHTVPNEKVVNEGGHKAGSDFELVKWASGEIRHNTFYTKGKSNRKNKPAKLRVMYVLGHGLDLEYAYRGLAKAKKDGKYAVGMKKRAEKAVAALSKINNASAIPAVASMLKIAKETPLDYKNSAVLTASAKKIATLNQQFLANNDGKKLSALNSFLPKKYKGKPKK